MNTTVIDVRTPEEFIQGNVPGSINIPLNTLAHRVDEIKVLNTNIVLCCASGGRSFSAYQYLKAQGINNISDGGSWFSVANSITN